MKLSALDYLEKIAIAKDRIQGQTVWEAIYKLDPDVEFYEKQRRKIEEYDRKIIEVERGGKR